MAELTVIDGALVVKIRGAEDAPRLAEDLSIPLAHIVAAVRDPNAVPPARPAEPGSLDSDADDDTKWLWAVDDPAKAIIVILRDNEFDQLVLDVDDPEAAVRLIASHVD